jgi:hypothetical protein
MDALWKLLCDSEIINYIKLLLCKSVFLKNQGLHGELRRHEE